MLMTRRRAGRQLPWAARGSGGLYGDRGNPGLARLGFLAAIVVGVVLIAVFLLAKACGGGDCGSDKYYCESSRDIRAPEGFERVSKIYEYNTSKGAVPAGTDVNVLLPLSKTTTDARNLSFYRYAPATDTWEPIAPAVLDPQGKQVSATFNDTPAVLAVMRRLSPAGHVVAYLGHNAVPNREAAGRITILHTLDFRPAADGSVQGDLSTIKPDASFAFYPVISASLGDKGSIPIVTSILSSSPSRSNHVQQIVKKVAERQLAGIDIAYLDLPADQRTSLTLFVTELGQALHAQNKMLTLTLPPPLKAQDRIDEGAYDWAELAKAADVLQIAPYRDQGSYRTTMPEILEHITGVANPSKIVLTVSPYATEKATDGLRTLTLTDAMVIATKLSIRSGADQKLTTNSNVDVVGVNIDKSANLTGIVWDAASACVAFSYQLNGGRTVWIENAFSVGFKLEFISRYKLGGVAIEDASDNVDLGNIWAGLVPFMTTGQPVLLQPNPGDLQPKWKPSKGTIEGGQRGSVKWSTPAEPGNYTVSLTLSDGVALFENEVSVNVQAKDTPRTPQPGQTPS